MSDLIVQRDAPVKRLTLNRPDKRNALNLSLAEVLLEAEERERLRRILAETLASIKSIPTRKV